MYIIHADGCCSLFICRTLVMFAHPLLSFASFLPIVFLPFPTVSWGLRWWQSCLSCCMIICSHPPLSVQCLNDGTQNGSQGFCPLGFHGDCCQFSPSTEQCQNGTIWNGEECFCAPGFICYLYQSPVDSFSLGNDFSKTCPSSPRA